MKAFNIEEYLADPSKKIITRNGRPARIICTDRKTDSDYPIVALIALKNNDEQYYCFTKEGIYSKGSIDRFDLFFATVKRQGWINLYKSVFNILPSLTVYETKEDAVKSIYSQDCYIDTIKIEWEE